MLLVITVYIVTGQGGEALASVPVVVAPAYGVDGGHGDWATSWAHGAWLGERRAKSALVLWHWVWIVVVRTDRGNGTRWRVTHVGWQLADDVSGWRWRWHWRYLVVNHVRCSWALRRVLHGDAERGRRRPVMCCCGGGMIWCGWDTTGWLA